MVHLFHIAAIVKNTSTVNYKAFHQACINIFNKRYREFNDPQYLLAFFLHLAWKSGRVKDEIFIQLSITAWLTIFNSNNQLQQLATKLFSISPHSANLELLGKYVEDYIRNLMSIATVNNDDKYNDLPDDFDLTDLNDEEGSDVNSS
ncbi:hypothetical protein C1646_772263 [Rhizophagus diaphanus]|nr:hypothetical protein C1646_772263 [Rhizophagus diaphanus] [Rhizophagus sp. MUCL 43196]